MRRLAYAILLASILCSTLFLPATSALGDAQVMVEVFGQTRQYSEDIIMLYDGSTLRGTLLDEVIGIITPYGDLLVPIRMCAGISFSTTGNDSVITVNYNRVTGIVYTREFGFNVSATGATIKIDKGTIKHIILRQNTDETAFLGSINATGVLVMANGDILSGKLGPDEIWVKTNGSSVKTSLVDIKRMSMVSGSTLGVDVSMADGTVLMGRLETEHMNLTMDIGTYMDGLHITRLNEMYVGKSAEQVKALFSDEASAIGKQTAALAKQIALQIPGSSTELKMSLIPAGSFIMGSPASENDRYSDKGQHQVNISKPFYMGIYEVTQAQWADVMYNNPSTFKGSSNPVENVSWEDCQRFITRLNDMEIGTFRLPTEAEWEYACKAGSMTRFPWGDDSGYTQLGQYAWYDANSSLKTHPVGQKRPNIWGLYDMHGNVWEWCSDWYSAAAYGSGLQADPSGPTGGSFRVIRGGSCYGIPQFCQSAYRNYCTPSYGYDYLGFRLVRTSQ